MADAVLLAGGGTAGHVNPLLAVADELRRREPGVSIVALGTAEGLESTLIPARGYELTVIPRVPLPRRPGTALLRVPGRLAEAVRLAGAAMDARGVGVVVGFGGFVATPAYLAARRRGLPVVVHEQNARPGLANRLGARWARRVGVTFEGTPLPGAVVTGLPLRREMAELVERRRVDLAGSRAAARAELGLDAGLPTVLVTGGSLGAQRLNEAFAGSWPGLEGVQVLHLTGRGKDEAVRDVVRGGGGTPGGRYQVRDYLPEMHLGYAAADLVVGRAGAGTVCELSALGLPAVYVPLPIGNGEQRLNSAPVVAAGGGLLVEDHQVDADWVVRDVLPLVRDRDRLAAMAAAAAAVGVTDGASRVADLVQEARSGSRGTGGGS